MSAPRRSSARAMMSARCIVGSSASTAACTRVRNSASGDSRIARASSSCSAWANRSIATHSGGVSPSHTTTTSDGPAIMSMPTAPKTSRFAVATQMLPGPTILSTRGTVAVPQAIAATACAPPMVKTRCTPQIRAAASTRSFSSPPGAGTHITSSATPATCAGIAFMITDDG